MTLPQIVLAALFAAACQVAALRIATRLMVALRIDWASAAKIVVIEYIAAIAAAALFIAIAPDTYAAPFAAGALTYLLAGAACLSAWLAFGDGTPVGFGNGVLIQAIQIPLIIPVLIAGSFLFDLQTRLVAGG